MSAAYDTYNYPKYWNKRKYEHESEIVALNTFLKITGPRKHIIDIGCGFGRLADFYAAFTDKITLCEPSKKLLSRAKEHYKSDKTITYINSTIEALPGKTSAKYDTAVMVRVLHHIEDPGVAFKTVNKLLTKDGFFILEFANKMHGKALVKNILQGNFTFPLEIFSIDRRSRKNQNTGCIAFLNHHPDYIYKTLQDCGFEIIEKLSVSNFRFGVVKNLLPLKVLTKLEKMAQKRLSRFNFGPSIFVLAKKAHNT